MAFNAYTFDEYYCWFDSPFSSLGFGLRLGYFIVPLWTLFIVNMVLASLTYSKLREIQVPDNFLRIFQRLLLFPFIIFFTGAFVTADIIYDFAAQKSLIWLDAVGLIFVNLYGIFNAIVTFY